MIAKIKKRIFYIAGFLNVRDLFNYIARYSVFVFHKNILRKRDFKCSVLDFRLCLPLKDNGIERTLALSGKRELDHVFILKSAVAKNDVILDIGSHIGYYSVMAAALTGEKGAVYAAEPDERNFGFLKANIELNNMAGLISPYNIGMSDRSGEADFYVSEKSNLNTLNLSRFKFGPDAREYTRVKIKIRDLEEFLDELTRKVNLIRMDVEGHEVEILRSMLRLVDRASGVAPEKLIFETHFVKYDEKDHDIIGPLKGLFRNGYKVKMVSSTDERDVQAVFKSLQRLAVVKEYPYQKGIYEHIPDAQALRLISSGAVRTVFLERQ